MAQTIKLKRSATSGAAPTTSQLELGEVAINTYDGKMYIKKDVGGTESIVEITGGSGGSSNLSGLSDVTISSAVADQLLQYNGSEWVNVSIAEASAIMKEYQFTATSGQSTFSGSDNNSETLSYTAGAIQVFLNGIFLDSAVDYTATNGTSIVLAETVDANDYLQVVAFKKKIGDGNVSVDTFTGDDSTTAFTLSLDPGDENNTRVFIDGVYQSKSNYSVSGTTLTFSTAPPTGTAVEVEIGNRVVTLDTLSDLDLPDDVKLRLGTDQDLEIFHDGSNGFIKNTTGDLYIEDSNGSIRIRPKTGESGINVLADSAVELYYDNSKKLETTNDGVTVTGDVEADEFIGDLRGAVLFKAQAGEALAKGDVVYISGISGNTTIVSKADADDASKMPAFGLAAAAASANSSVEVYTSGTISGIDTSSFSVGDEVFTSTTAGELTATAPTGESAALQKIGKVTRSHASSGSLFIIGAGRSNAVPNLNEGKLFVGNSSNQAVADDTVHVDIANSRVGIGTSSPQAKLHLSSTVGAPIYIQDSDATSTFNITELSNNGGNFGIQTRNSSGTFVSTDYQIVKDANGAQYQRWFTAGNNERMRIDSSGNLLVGKTSVDDFSSAGAQIEAGGQFTSSVASAPSLRLNRGGTDGTIVEFNKAGSTVGSIGTNATANFNIFSSQSGHVGLEFGSPNIMPMKDGALADNAVDLGLSTQRFKDLYLSGKIWTNTTTGLSITANSSNRGILNLSTSQSYQLIGGSHYGYTGYKTGGYHRWFGSDGGEDMRIDSSGSVIVNNGGSGNGVIKINGATGNTEAVIFQRGGTEASRIGHANSADLTFSTGSGVTERMRIDSSGNVGIGVTDPQYLLHMNGGASRTDVQVTLSGYGVGATDGAQFGIQTQGAYIWNFENTDLYFATNNQRRLTINEDGNVGIGTSSPATTLDVEGNITLSGSNGKIYLPQTPNNFNWIGDPIEQTGIVIIPTNDGTSERITFAVDNSEAMRIDSSGNLLVGKTGTAVADTGVQWLPNGNSAITRSGGIALFLNRTSSDGSIVDFRKDNTSVGSIGTLSSALTIGTGDVGVQFNADVNAIMPHNISTGANVDASIDIGYSSGGTNRRFKDLYLSGAVKGGNGSASAPTFSFVNTTTMGMYRGAANQLAFSTNSTERMRIDSNGNVGIGTPNPQTALHIYDTPAEILRMEGNDEFAYASFYGTVSSTAQRLGYMGFANDTSTAADFNFANNQGGIFSFNAGIDVDGDSSLGAGGNGTHRIGRLTVDYLSSSNPVLSSDGSQINFNDEIALRGVGIRKISTSPSNLNITQDRTGYDIVFNTSPTTNAVNEEVIRFTHDRKVGIGDSDPAELLTVKDGSIKLKSNNDGNNGILMLYDAAGTQSGQVYPSAGDLRIWSPNDVLILPTGNVGIGTSSPAAPLHVSSTGHAHIFEGTGGNVSLKLQRSDASGAVDFGDIQFVNNTAIAARINSRGEGSASGNLTFQTRNTSGTLAEKLRIDSSGQATLRLGGSTTNSAAVISSCTSTSSSGGAGTGNYLELEAMEPNNPNYGAKKLRLGVQGGGYVKMTMPGAAGLFIESPYQTADKIHVGYAGVQLDMNGGGFGGNQHMLIRSKNDITFNPGSSEKVRFDSSGKVGIGRSSPNAKLDINAGTTKGIEIALGTSSVPFINFLYGATTVGSITTTGSVTAYNTSSDQRLKDNIVDAPSASDDIDAIQVRSFDWKADGSHQKYGMVAQELQSVAPEAVTEGATEEDMMGVDYSKLVPMLVKALQESRQEINNLKSRVEELESQ